MKKRRVLPRWALIAATVAVLLSLTGCSSTEVPFYEPRSQEELDAVDAEATKILEEFDKSKEEKSAEEKSNLDKAYSTEKLKEGNAKFKEEKYDEAIKAYDEQLAEVPGEWGTMNNKVLALMEQEKNEEAFILALATAKRHRSNHPEVLVNYLTAGHSQRFAPLMLLQQLDMSTSDFSSSITRSDMTSSAKDQLMNSLRYNLIYMNMEGKTETGTEKTLKTKKDLEQYTKNLSNEEFNKILDEMIEAGDEDATQLKEYFNSLMAAKEIE